MNEVKRVAKVGETIKVIHEYNPGWRQQPYPIGSKWVVRKVFNKSKGLVACDDNEFCISMKDYVVIE
ncbi:hypothetical protein ACIQW7_24465 [Peribacillus simplex]|uniref:hypothetical protein n=1 Tax=Peribacillus simplex TaxID=1478 RepID=UPI00382C1301